MTLSNRIRKRRKRVRKASLRPEQIGRADTRYPDFEDECRHQSMLVAAVDASDLDLVVFMDAVLADSGDDL